MADETEPTGGRVLWSASTHSLWERDWFGPTILLAFLAFLVLSFFRAPQVSHDLIAVLIGYMASWVQSIVDFKYGSTAGSRAKDDTIRQLSQQ